MENEVRVAYVYGGYSTHGSIEIKSFHKTATFSATVEELDTLAKALVRSVEAEFRGKNFVLLHIAVVINTRDKLIEELQFEGDLDLNLQPFKEFLEHQA